MSTARMLPLAAPVAAGLSATTNGVVVVLSILLLLLTLLLIRSLRRPEGTEHPADTDHR
jgi:hypothetical protein